MPYATYRFNKIIAAETIRFIVTVAIVVYKGLKLVVYRMLTLIRNNIKKGKIRDISPILPFHFLFYKINNMDAADLPIQDSHQ